MNKMTFSGICNKVCNMAIANYHLLNHTDRPKKTLSARTPLSILST